MDTPWGAMRSGNSMIAVMKRYRVALQILAMAGCVLTPAVLVAQERPEQVDLPQTKLPLPPHQALPSRDCWTCGGPAPPRPCLQTHRGFLYFGTYPWDDDPCNGFCDCPGGDCGECSARLSLGWIRHREPDQPQCRCAPLRRGPSGCGAVPHYWPEWSPLSQPIAVGDE